MTAGEEKTNNAGAGEIILPGLGTPPEEVVQVPEERGVVEEEEEIAQAMPTQKLAVVKKPLLVAPSPAAMRDELEELVIRDLLGPAGGEEEEVDEARLRER